MLQLTINSSHEQYLWRKNEISLPSHSEWTLPPRWIDERALRQADQPRPFLQSRAKRVYHGITVFFTFLFTLPPLPKEKVKKKSKPEHNLFSLTKANPEKNDNTAVSKNFGGPIESGEKGVGGRGYFDSSLKNLSAISKLVWLELLH